MPEHFEEKDDVSELVISSPVSIVLPIIGGVMIFLMAFIAVMIA